MKNRYTIATFFLLAFFFLSIFLYSFFFTKTILQPPLSHRTDLYIQVKPSPLLSPPPPPQQPPPPPPTQESSSSITVLSSPSVSTIVSDPESESVAAVTHTEKKIDNAAALALKDCDLYTGTWVEDEDYPIYQPGSCPYVDEAYDCKINGRNDTHYTNWRWKPHGCDLPRFSAKDFLERLKGKKLMLVGDSMNRNQFESILCILREGLQNKSKMYEIHGHKISKGRGYFVFKFEDYNCTVAFVRSHFLVREGIRMNAQRSSNPTLSIDRIDKTSARWKKADILVFNTGHWWAHGKTARGINYYKEGDYLYPKYDGVEAYRKAIKTWGKWIDKNINPKKADCLLSWIFFGSFQRWRLGLRWVMQW